MLGDFLCLPVLLWAALALRYDTSSPPVFPGVPAGLLLVAALGVLSLSTAGVYRAVVRAFDENFLQQLLAGVGANVAVLSIAGSVRAMALPRSVPFIYGFLMFLWVWASRSAIRHGVRVLMRLDRPATRVAIYGAGAAGRQTLAALRAAPEYLVVAFFDDEPQLAGTRVQGIRVYPGARLVGVCASLQLEEVLIALPSESRARRRAVIERIEPANVRVRTLPGISQLVNGKVSIADIQEVDIADLLGRDPVPPLPALTSQDIRGKRVMVTGGGGSIGSELCRQVLAEGPDLLLVLELNEFALYRIDQEVRANAGDTLIVSVLGSVLDEERMRRLMSHYDIDTVYHAAAYKHVPLVESNPFEGLINNVIGTLSAARAALSADVSRFVLVSTDKAVRPTNVMGASKRLAELVLQGLASEPDTRTRFCIVRFGNVLGSSGSVIPLFREQIAKGGPVTVTHPEVTRYFMTIPEAAQLVIQAGSIGSGGDVFVLDMGEPVRIIDLARKMIRLCGWTVRDVQNDVSGGVEIAFTGLRPGEKLYEELLIGDDVTGTEHPRIMRAVETMIPFSKLEFSLELMVKIAAEYDVGRMKRLLADLIDGYTPDMSASVSDAPPPMPTPIIPLRAGA